MDSDSYLLHILNSGSQHTADSLYLQTTIGRGIRWPIILLISTIVFVAFAVTCLIWRNIRRPYKDVVNPAKVRHHCYGEHPQIVISSARLVKGRKFQNLSHGLRRTASYTQQETGSLLGRSWTKSEAIQAPFERKVSLPLPKRRVSWASSNSIKHIPCSYRHRRHSEISQPSTKQFFLVKGAGRRHSASGISTMRATYDASTNGSAIIKVNKPSQFHHQISKTIAVLDDLNKSLQEDPENIDPTHPEEQMCSSVPSADTLTKKKKPRHHKFFKPVKQAFEPSSLPWDIKIPVEIPECSKHLDELDGQFGGSHSSI